MNALTSFGKQLPPYPRPASRNRGLIRLSIPMALAMVVTSAPWTFSHMLAIWLMKLILEWKYTYRSSGFSLNEVQ